jgi:endonuclease YncB( thermonuclease family)
MNNLVFNYKARVDQVVDGSTIDAELDLGFRLKRTVRMRIVGIDLGKPAEMTPTQRAISDYMREMLKSLIEGRSVVISTLRPNYYGRCMCKVYVPCKRQNVNYPMLTSTYAGTRFLNVSFLLSLAAEKAMREGHQNVNGFIKEISDGLELYDY